IATDLALSWARLPVGGDVSWWSSRLTVVRKLCPTLRTKRISAHTLRHTAAMQLLHAGVDTSVIALWLGTRRSTPPRSIYMPISASRSEPSRGQSHRQPSQVGSDRPTRCSPSWRRSDYAEVYATN